MSTGTMLREVKYSSVLCKLLDDTSHGLMYPWLLFVSFFFASYISTTNDTWRCRVVQYFIIGPVCLICSACLLPFGISGFALWIVLCNISHPSPYTYWESRQTQSANSVNSGSGFVPNTFTIITGNMCLLPEFMARYNNNSFTYWRSKEIGLRLLNSLRLLHHNDYSHSKDEFGIATQFLPADFICFQEIWERRTARLLMNNLQHRYKYFLYDIGQNKLGTNLFWLGSGLMFASRYRILDTDFHSFSVKTLQSSLVSLGLLLVKVELNRNEEGKLVGYIATTHLQAYQGKKPIIVSQLDQTLGWLHRFQTATLQSNEIVAFDIFCGDFNFDNISPGDKGPSHHRLFDEYADPCRITAGHDKKWAIGTEMRQRMLWSSKINNPDKFKRALEDPIFRRYFLLDADVKIHTLELAFLGPPYDENGRVREEPHGGMRRIDYILYRKSSPVEVHRYNFITALAQLTDHIPVTMTFSVPQHSRKQF